MKYSIIVPIFNTNEEYLSNCIESLIHQTYYEVEIILVNDGSTNKTPEICDAYAEKDRRISVIHQSNRGVSAARNAGIISSSGEWIVFVDPDDWVENNLVQFIDENITDDLDILMFTFDRGFANNIKVHNWYKEKYEFVSQSDKDKLLLGVMNATNDFYPLWVGTVWAKAYKKEILIRNSIFFNERLPKAQDLIFNLYAINSTSKILFVNKVLYHYRINNNSVSHKYNDLIFENITRTVNSCIEFVDNEKDSQQFIDAAKSFTVHAFAVNMHLDFFSKGNKKTFFERRKDFLLWRESEPYKTAFKSLEYNNYSLGLKIYLFLIKYKQFSLLNILLHMRK